MNKIVIIMLLLFPGVCLSQALTVEELRIVDRHMKRTIGMINDLDTARQAIDAQQDLIMQAEIEDKYQEKQMKVMEDRLMDQLDIIESQVDTINHWKMRAFRAEAKVKVVQQESDDRKVELDTERNPFTKKNIYEDTLKVLFGFGLGYIL